MDEKKPQCFRCGSALEVGLTGRRDECSKCSADVHVCKNCGHYDASVYNECREPQADRVVEKERSNFCDYFLLVGAQSPKSSLRDETLKNLDALFKK